MKELLAGLFVLAFGFGLLFFFAFITAVVVMLCWNYLFVGESSILGFSLVEIGYFQAWVLTILCGLLFKSSNSSSSSSSKK